MKKIISVLLLSIFFCTGFLGFFESNEEKSLKQLVDNYYYIINNSDKNNINRNIKSINTSNIPTDCQQPFYELIDATIDLKKGTSDLWIIADMVMDFADYMGGGMGGSSMFNDRRNENANNYSNKLNNFQNCASKYGVDKKYFDKSAKKYRKK